MRAILSVRSLLLAVAMSAFSAVCFAQVGVSISVGFPPPELPVYTQPVCPGEDYIWTPGYWAWDGQDYYWVPGTWVLAPQVGYFWTPPYWGWNGVAFAFYPGYWGPQVGFYGGINYGFGYFGGGYVGGHWDHGHFFYNRAVTNVNVTVIHNVYVNKVNINESRISFNGGRGGVQARPTAQEQAYGREKHTGPVAVQNQHMQDARNNKDLRASVNHGKPPIAATAKPSEFSRGATKATAAAHYTPPPNLSNEQARATHSNELPAVKPLPAPNTGNAKLDQQYQQERSNLYAAQQKDRQELQQRQEQEHQQMARQNASAAQKQQMEQNHQQQTRQMAQYHAQEQQTMTQRQQAPQPRAEHPAARPR